MTYSKKKRPSFFSWFETASDDSLSRAVTVAAADTTAESEGHRSEAMAGPSHGHVVLGDDAHCALSRA